MGARMMEKLMVALPLVALVAACGGGDSNSAGGDIKIVGSSTVYPFTTAVAEQFMKDNAGTRIVVESTGTGAGAKLFCAGVGDKFPDMLDASRALKASEYETCVANGAKNIIEVAVGIDGLTFIEGKDGPGLNLTVEDIYKALAANPFGKGPNTAKTWKDVNPALPAIAIKVMGPPTTSGTRDSLADLILEKGCDSDPAMKDLKKADEKKHKEICTGLRTDGGYVEAGENDNLLVQKVSQEPGTLGVLGFSYLDENADKVKPVALKGVTPTEETIANLSYPGSRKLYVYLKGEHMAAKPAMKKFIEAYSKVWGKGGALEKKGLVPFGGADAEAAVAQATALKPLDPTTLK
jgi:phosphate transport system substrate-binding protein